MIVRTFHSCPVMSAMSGDPIERWATNPPQWGITACSSWEKRVRTVPDNAPLSGHVRRCPDVRTIRLCPPMSALVRSAVSHCLSTINQRDVICPPVSGQDFRDVVGADNGWNGPPPKGGSIPATATRPAADRCPQEPDGLCPISDPDLAGQTPPPHLRGSFLGSACMGVIRTPLHFGGVLIYRVEVRVIVVVSKDWSGCTIALVIGRKTTPLVGEWANPDMSQLYPFRWAWRRKRRSLDGGIAASLEGAEKVGWSLFLWGFGAICNQEPLHFSACRTDPPCSER